MSRDLASVLFSAAVGLPWLVPLAVAARRRGPGAWAVAAGAACALLAAGAGVAHFATELAGGRGFLNRPWGWVASLGFAPLTAASWALLALGLRTAWRDRDREAATDPAG